MSERIAKRLLIIGWDAADWKIIDALFASGGMPNLRRLVDGGVRANLASLEPRLSPLLWSSIATGKTPDKHGILNFVEPEPSGSGIRISSSTTRKTKALWNILTQSKMRCNVVSWYASHPAEPVSGACVSNLFCENMPNAVGEPWPMPKGAVHPESWEADIAALRVHPSQIPPNVLVPLIPTLTPQHLSDSRVGMLARNLAHCLTVHNAATAILGDSPEWDCTMVFYETIDTVGHNFMQFHPPRMSHVQQADFELFCEVMYGIYQFHDMMLGTLLDLAGPETTVMLLSDHGFYSDHRRPVVKDMSVEQRAMVEAQWHRPLGVLVMNGPGIKPAQTVYGATLLDITPTALALLGLPIGADMSGRALSEAFVRPMKPETVFSWDMVEGEAGMHPPDVRQDPFEARDAIKQLVDLGYMASLPEEANARVDMVWRESQANLGTVYITSGQPEKAVEVFEGLVEKYPAERRFKMALLRALYVSGNLPKCRSVLREHIDKHVEDLDARIMLAAVLAASDDTDEAIAQLDLIERAHDGRLEREAALGDLNGAVGRWPSAERHYQRALEYNPDAAAVHHGLAQAAIGLEKFDEAAEHCLRAVELVHVYPDAHHTLGVALTWLKDYPHAIKSFEVALSMRPGMIDSQRYLASIYRHLGDAENAAKHRRLAEQLMNDKSSGRMSIDQLTRKAPLGPQEWVARIASKSEPRTSS